jgi:hypothetical protein
MIWLLNELNPLICSDGAREALEGTGHHQKEAYDQWCSGTTSWWWKNYNSG